MPKSFIQNGIKQCTHSWSSASVGFQPQIENTVFDHTWLNLQMQIQGYRGLTVFIEKNPHVCGPVSFKGQLYMQLLPVPFDPAQGSHLAELSSWLVLRRTHDSFGPDHELVHHQVFKAPHGGFLKHLYWLQKWLKPSTPLEAITGQIKKYLTVSLKVLAVFNLCNWINIWPYPTILSLRHKVQILTKGSYFRGQPQYFPFLVKWVNNSATANTGH